MNKSANIRNIFDESNHEMSISAIAEKANVRYQFAYQVIKRYCNKNDIKFPANAKNKKSKADKIREMYDENMTIGAIAKELNTNYTYAWQVCDKHRKNK